MSVAFLAILVYQGFILAFSNINRIFHALGLSYSWATISVPIGSILMIISIVIKSVNLIREFKATN